MLPPTKPINTAMERMNPFANICTPTMRRIVTNASSRFVLSPKSAAVALPPPIFSIATGINVKPITVITVPVTKGGNNFLILEKIPETNTTKIPEAIIDP